MKRTGLVMMMVAGLWVGTMLLKSTQAQPAPAPAPQAACPVAVCNVVGVFQNYQRTKDLSAWLDSQSQSIKAEDAKRGQAIDAIKMELEGLKPGSKEYESRFDEMQHLTIERQAWVQYQQQVARRNYRRTFQEIYEECLKMIRRVATEKGYRVVLERNRANLDSNSMEELFAKIDSRQVLYNDDAIDITDTVLARLNEAYKLATTKP